MLIAKKAMTLLIAVLLGASVSACKPAVWPSDPKAAFFPLKPNMMWMYSVQSQSQHANYTVTDLVIGSQFVPALNLTGEVVQEFYDLDRGGLRPIVYTEKNGYFVRMSGLDYIQHQIKPPGWGRTEEDDFLPQHLTPNQSWSNKLFPYGHMAGAFDIDQSHKSFKEMSEVVVPAGRFQGCIRIETLARYENGVYAQKNQHLSLKYLDWYAPNVGLIRTLVYPRGGAGPEMERVELIRFSAAAPTAPSQPPTPHKDS